MSAFTWFLLAALGCADHSQIKPIEEEPEETESDEEESGAESDSAEPSEEEPPEEEPPEEEPSEPDPCDGTSTSEESFEAPQECPMGRCPVPAGEFTMGSFEGYRDECPARIVTLDGFEIDKTEVTWDQYDDCVIAGACTNAPEYCRDWAEGLGSASNRPVTCVTWAQADNYCRAQGGRLPSEAEWEKAARGTTGSKWPWGSFPPNCEITNYRFVAWYCEAGVMTVGHYLNEGVYGAQDMAGNAWEWVADHYDAEWYRTAPNANPPGPSENCRPAEGAPPEPCVDRVLRGGAYNSTALNIRGSVRSSARPDRIDKNIGFRCAYSL